MVIGRARMLKQNRAGPMSTNVHSRTPELKANDPRGLPTHQVAYLRKVAGAEVDALITRQHHDTLGRLVEQWDPRLFDKAPKPNQATVYRLSGEALRVDSVDAGQRLSLLGLGGEILQHWDQREHHWRTTYDNQLRVVAVEENAQPNVETFTYADASADPGHNRRGQLLEQTDRAGVLSFSGFSLLGQPLSETRTFPDARHYTSHRHYSALGAVLTQTDAGGHLQHTRYNIAGQLKQVMLQLDTASPRQDILKDAQYNAASQIIEQHAGNDVISIWGYDPIDGRLHTLKAGIPGKALCQDLEYFHDRVGNVLRIEDHTLSTVFFANQRVDGLRTFAYDSLYRLIRASGFEAEKPNLQPGLPDLITPIDPNRRFNYTQHYDYDRGNNLTKLCHRRDGNNFTRQMRIDEHSNRGVSWEEGDPEPIFDELFDHHGNQLLLQRGQPMSWNTRDQLAKVTLLTHSNGLPDDEETYLYSQGVRVYKHHVWHTPSANHFHDVRYLPGLEIRTRSDGQQLHVITLSTGVGSVHCLHWVSGIPADIEPDQLRYHLGDHLNSIALELDRNGALISLEFYYSYGGTCWYAARSEVEADYKTLRYSGKEMDVSGLYYYGARYYAPWLWRWVSPDPAGNVDGLNRYQMVGSNPIRSIDNGGTNKEDHEQLRQDLTYYASVLSTLGKELKSLNYQIYNSFNSTDINKRLIKNLTFHATKGLAKVGVSTATTLAFPGGSGAIAAPVASFITGLIADKLGTKGEFSTSMLPDASKLDPHTIHAESTGLFTRQKVKNVIGSYDPRTSQGKEKIASTTVSLAAGQAGVPAASEIIEGGTAIKNTGIAHIGIPENDIAALRSRLVQIVELLKQDGIDVPAAFNTLEVLELYAEDVKGIVDMVFDSATGHLGTSDSKTIKLEKLEQKRETRIAQAERGIVLLDKYSEYIRKR